MSNVIGFSNLTRDAMLDAITSTIGTSGVIKLYTGTRPATADTALSGNTLLGTLTFSSTAAPAASGTSHIWTANAITQDSAADATGTATFARVFQSNGTTAIFDCDVATSGGVINLNTTSIVTGGPIVISSFTITLP